MAEGPDPAVRISASIQKLAASAANLNKASDEFGKHALAVNEALQRLNIGIEVWQLIKQTPSDDGSEVNDYVGYARVDGHWGLALSTVHHEFDGEVESDEEWAFNDGPRSLRIEAIDKLPDLLDKIAGEAEKAARKLESSVGIAEAITKAVREITNEKNSRVGGRS